MYFTIVIVGIIILLLFRALSYINKIMPFSKKTKHHSGYILPIVELIAWIGFAIWCLRLIYEFEAFTTLIILGIIIVLLMAPAWFLVRDFLYGMLLKIQRKIEIDAKIEIGDLKGVIVKTDYFTFDVKTKNGDIDTIPYNKIVKTKNGDIDTIPYNKIRSEIITKNAANIHLEKQLISFKIPSKTDINRIIIELKTTIINAPWVAGSQEPIINVISSETGNYVIEAIVYVLKKEHAEKIVEYVERNFILKLG